MKQAEDLFQGLPEEYQTGESRGGEQRLAYVEAELEMFTQAETVNLLVKMLGYIPELPEDEECPRD
ncbi:transcriptional repressor TraM [Neorhizobium sp. NCHU2750]|uniref:transcriptional repressor TraM n=1 Tax=Neorhizobium sp. NCHU2750 TaxID=1825976 RepID=UPI000E75ADA2